MRSILRLLPLALLLTAGPGAAAPITLNYTIDPGGGPFTGVGVSTGGSVSFTFSIPGSASTCSTYLTTVTTGPFPVYNQVNNCGPVAVAAMLSGTGGTYLLSGLLTVSANLSAGGAWNVGHPFFGSPGLYGFANGTGASNPSDGAGVLQALTLMYYTPFISYGSGTFIQLVASVYGQTGQEVPEPGTGSLLIPALLLLAPALRGVRRKRGTRDSNPGRGIARSSRLRHR